MKISSGERYTGLKKSAWLHFLSLLACAAPLSVSGTLGLFQAYLGAQNCLSTVHQQASLFRRNQNRRDSHPHHHPLHPEDEYSLVDESIAASAVEENIRQLRMRHRLQQQQQQQLQDSVPVPQPAQGQRPPAKKRELPKITKLPRPPPPMNPPPKRKLPGGRTGRARPSYANLFSRMQ